MCGDPGLVGLGAGERETLKAYGEGAWFVIVDDRKAALYCRRKQIAFVNAVLCARILYASGYIDYTVYFTALQKLQDIGRYTADILDFARDCPIDQLSYFWPAKAPKMHGLRNP